jgi:hypothetical protein
MHARYLWSRFSAFIFIFSALLRTEDTRNRAIPSPTRKAQLCIFNFDDLQSCADHMPAIASGTEDLLPEGYRPLRETLTMSQRLRNCVQFVRTKPKQSACVWRSTARRYKRIRRSFVVAQLSGAAAILCCAPSLTARAAHHQREDRDQRHRSYTLAYGPPDLTSFSEGCRRASH